MKDSQIKLSVAIATHNEEANIGACLKAVAGIADEIVVVDGESNDKTVEIAKSFGARVYVVPNVAMFHINKLKSFEKCRGEWILYLDADEIVTRELAAQIMQAVEGNYDNPDLSKYPLFAAHMRNVAARDGVVYSQEPPVYGYFFPRKNYFLGSFLMHSGVYPDGVIRLFKRGFGYLPCKSVHEQVVVDGGVSWLTEPLTHMSDPTFNRYVERANRYTSLTAQRLAEQHVSKSVFSSGNYIFYKPVSTFLSLYLRHRGYMDGFSGFVWALMSGLHYPIAYLKYLGQRN